jgi:hypothetical protein
MQLRLIAPKDILAGVIFVAFGAATFFMAHRYDVGTALEMGPGYFPAAMALVLIGVGVGAIIRGILRKQPDPITAHKLEPLALIFAGVLVFSFLIERAGLIIASAALIGIACFRRIRTNPLEVFIVYVALTGFSALVFVQWFGMQMPLWPGG